MTKRRGEESDETPSKHVKLSDNNPDQQQLSLSGELSHSVAAPTEHQLVDKIFDKYTELVDKYDMEKEKRIRTENLLKDETSELLNLKSMLNAAGVIKRFDDISRVELKSNYGWSDRDATDPKKLWERYMVYYKKGVGGFRKTFKKLLKDHEQTFASERMPVLIKGIQDRRNGSAHGPPYKLVIRKEAEFTQDERVFLQAVCDCAFVKHDIEF